MQGTAEPGILKIKITGWAGSSPWSPLLRPGAGPYGQGKELGDLVRLPTHLGVASDTCKNQRPPDPWHLLGEPEQKERAEDLKQVLRQDLYREISSPKYSWAEMTNKQPVLFLFSWEIVSMKNFCQS